MRQQAGIWMREHRRLAECYIWEADTWITRARGLLARPPLRPGEALRIRPCNSIHCFFMCLAIDVVFIDADNKVIRLCERVRPWRMRYCWSACAVVEMAEGEITRLGLREGDHLAMA